MDNQHRQIRGYRELTQAEIDLMNQAKALEAEVLAFHQRIHDTLSAQVETQDPVECRRAYDAQAFRWHAKARTDIEAGFMALIRAIAQPQPQA